jgi:uncharacterized membrane protein
MGHCHLRVALLLLGGAGCVITALPAWSAPSADSSVESRTGGAGTEEPEEVEAVEANVQNAAEPQRSPLQLLGRMHPLFVHFPIAWLILLLIVDLVTFGLKRPGLAASGYGLLGGTMLAFIPALLTGLLRAKEVSSGAEHELLELHRNVAFTLVGLCAVALSLRAWRRNRLAGAELGIYLLLILAAAALVGLVGHLGGKMVFGVDYLPF